MSNETGKIAVTNMHKSGELKLGMKDKNGKTICFVYGMTIDETMIDKDMLKSSMETGLLSAYLKKGWAVKGRINVNNKIIGSPVKFEKVEAGSVVGQQEKIDMGVDGVALGQQEFHKTVEIKLEQIITKTENKDKGVTSEFAEVINANSNVNKVNEGIEEVPTIVAKKRGRPAKASVSEVVEVKDIEEVIKATETPKVEEVKKEDDFV